MEEEIKQAKSKKDYFLPISLLVAAIIIAGAVVYSNGLKSDDNGGSGDPVTVEKELALSEADYIFGSADAPITLFEYSDYECPFCVRFYSDAKPLLEESYIKTGKAKLAFRALAYHQESPFIMNAVLCAADQGKYAEMHEFVFSQQLAGGGLEKDDFSAQAQSLGLNASDFVSCVDNDTHKAETLANTQIHQEAGFRATPILVIAKSDKLPANFDSNNLVSQINGGQNVISLADGVVAIVGAQPFALYQSEIEKLLK